MALDVSDVGSALREARTARGVPIERVAEETRIHPRYLEALERDAPPGEFPAPVYARAFLREYARAVGLDPDPLVERYREEHAEPEPPSLRPPVPIERAHRRWPGVVLVAASLGVLVVLGTLAVQAPEELPTPTLPVPPAAGSPSPTVDEAVEPTPSPRPRVTLRIRVVDRPSWLRVTRGERVLFEGTADPGFVQTFTAPRSLGLVAGDAGAVRLRVGGQSLGRVGGPGEVYRAEFVLRGDRVRVRPG